MCKFSIARGVGIWRLNINILEENEFVESMNAQLEGLIKKQEKSIASLADKWEEIKLSLIQTAQDYSHARTADRRATIMQLEKYIQKLELNEEENYDLLLKTKNDYKELLEEKVRGAVFRAKCLWYADSEKSTKYFMNLEKSRSGAKGMSAVLDYNKIITHPQQILDRLVDFYSKLYTKDPDVIFKHENTEQILISEETQMRIEGNITLEELSTALKSMKRNKAPGCSGLPMEMYVIFWRLIGERLCQSINFAYEKGKLHDSALKGIIILIPKKGKDSRIVANLRPITLLNTDYKLIEKVLANHLKTALTEVISQDQKGFLAERHISCNIRRVIDLIEYTEETSAEGVVLSLDFEKCFDRVDIKALIEALKYFGVKESFIRWTKLIYNGPVAAVSNNGFLSRWFEVTRSVKQGGPCSCYFFLAIAEVLAVELRKNPNIKGFMINEIKSILGQFADDMDLYLNDKKSVDEAIKTISTFEKSSGFKVNYDKTVLYRLGSLAKVDAQKYCAKLSWSETELNILGVNITHKIEKTIQSNYERILVKVGATLNVWRRRNLSLVVLNIGLIRMNILMLDTRNVEQTKDVRMYIEEFILVDLDTLELNIEVRMNEDAWKNTGLYTLATKDWLL